MNPRPLFLVLLLSSAVAAQVGDILSLSRFGITWTFDKKYPAGQFANGDHWVVGPVKIVGIWPRSKQAGGWTRNGSMLNPTPTIGNRQGYDSAMEFTRYDPKLNVALGVSPSKPLVLAPHSSLVSTISMGKARNRPQLKTAAILTVVDKPPPAGSFRPAYCGDRTVRFNVSQLNFSKLHRLQPVKSTPSLKKVEQAFERPWIDHIPGWSARSCHPKDNMPDYGRDIAVTVGDGALMLQLDISDTLKTKLLVRYVQLGIDLFGIVRNGGQANWQPDGGHASGRKFPILFAGVMLGDKEMSNIGQDSKTHFGEDGQTFYVRETSVGVYNHGHGGYGPQDEGKPDWGIRHATDPKQDNKVWSEKYTPYRFCCTANGWVGFVLAARIMGLKSAWNHDALFDYQDRYIAETRRLKKHTWTSWTAFPLDMWDAYREYADRPTGLVAKVVLEDAFDRPRAMPDKRVVALQWDSFVGSKNITYNLYRQEGSQPLVLLSKGLARETYEDSTVQKGKTYVYVLRAVHGRTEGLPSSPVRVTL